MSTVEINIIEILAHRSPPAYTGHKKMSSWLPKNEIWHHQRPQQPSQFCLRHQTKGQTVVQKRSSQNGGPSCCQMAEGNI